jgi:hypothetical protein
MLEALAHLTVILKVLVRMRMKCTEKRYKGWEERKLREALERSN